MYLNRCIFTYGNEELLIINKFLYKLQQIFFSKNILPICRLVVSYLIWQINNYKNYHVNVNCLGLLICLQKEVELPDELGRITNSWKTLIGKLQMS